MGGETRPFAPPTFNEVMRSQFMLEISTDWQDSSWQPDLVKQVLQIGTKKARSAAS
jgi:hypothetical protein